MLRVGGGPRPELSLKDQILLMLSYWRNYGTFLETGAKFGVSESTAFRVCRWVEDNLKKKKIFHLPGKKALLSGKSKYEIVLVDATECPIERPKRKRSGRRRNVQKQFYSGKKKRHTVKEQIIVDTKTGTIVATAFTNGKTHDFALFKNSKSNVHPETKILGDSGYQGINNVHDNSQVPKKQTKKRKLTPEEKLENHALSSKRVVVENVIGSVKKFKIVSQRYRNRRSRFGLRFNLICAIHNMECSMES